MANVSDATDLEVREELAVALSTMAGVERSIRSADTKSGMLAAFLGLTVAGASGQLASIHATLTANGTMRSVALAALAMFAISLCIAVTALGLTQSPRLTVPPTVRRLAFPALAAGLDEGLKSLSVVEWRDEAWSQAEALARIAVRKFRYLSTGLIWSGFCLLAFLIWLGVSAVLAG
jgi:hypothetical protein